MYFIHLKTDCDRQH